MSSIKKLEKMEFVLDSWKLVIAWKNKKHFSNFFLNVQFDMENTSPDCSCACDSVSFLKQQLSQTKTFLNRLGKKIFYDVIRF